MDEKDKATQQLKEAYALNEKLEKGEVSLLPPKLALANCKAWINERAATTGSARTLQGVLLSLANQRNVNLSALRALDPERRLWLASVVVGLSFLEDKELISTAGGLESD
jgi:ligand-binding sensor domain-containing protein